MIYAFTTLTNEKLRQINKYKYDNNIGFKRIQTLVYTCMYIYIQYTGKNMADNCSIAHCEQPLRHSCHCIVETELIQLGKVPKLVNFGQPANFILGSVVVCISQP